MNNDELNILLVERFAVRPAEATKIIDLIQAKTIERVLVAMEKHRIAPELESEYDCAPVWNDAVDKMQQCVKGVGDDKT